ncbi:MAG TPA: LysR substrate-binding domain-containing protein [Kofleriaceae bacterium]
MRKTEAYRDRSAAPPPACLDLDVLRTLVFAVDLGGFARAARRVGRTQSAVSLQMRRLEESAGQPLFTRAGRSFALTTAGEQVLGYARRLLAINDEAVAAVRGTRLACPVRLGVLADFAETWLPQVLARFARTHPTARLEVQVDRRIAMLDALDRGRLDLALVFEADRPRGVRLGDLPMAWIAPRGSRWASGSVLPLVLFEAPCVFRTAALAALDRAGIPWHVAFTSQSLTGIWAAVDAGLGVTVRTPVGVPRGLQVVDPVAGLPALPSTELWLLDASDSGSPLAAELRALLVRSISAALPLRGARDRRATSARSARQTARPPARRPRGHGPSRRA